ncbi:hypothetical protein GOBAR_AA34345 [Gossypium barbadense]|uniref:Citrate synthase n=1 Tax=Gossypium barbadense TaxID=3634 RepID=A0A2P5W5L0_GOSBA|nr:hypothetical protein GOBAR_AA34345 [Gossypium barbadense]
MGALAPALSTWIPEDDLLKNAIEGKWDPNCAFSMNIKRSSILEDPLPILEDKVDNETINWMMENFKLSVKQQIEAVLTKDELQHLAFLCKSEVDSIGRLTAGILWLLKLEKCAALITESSNSESSLVAISLEKAALSDEYFIKRKLYPNVDFYFGLIYRAMGFPPEFFTVLFAIPRMAGYLAHWHESLDDPDTKIIRPQQCDSIFLVGKIPTNFDLLCCYVLSGTQ